MRRQFNKNIDINLFDCIGRKPRRVNTITPEIIVGPIWLHNEQSAVEIIELNTSNETETTPRKTNYNMRHAWSYANDDGFQELDDRYKINKKARERRRMEIEKNMTELHLPKELTVSNERLGTNCIDNNLKLNHQRNCFTVINKHFIDSNTSTDDDYGDAEVITSSDLIFSAANWDSNTNYDNEDIITYDSDLDEESRTVMIYSFKNKHLLSDDVFGYNNCNKEVAGSSTSYSTDSSGEVKDKGVSACRIDSPKPHTYVPRLDLSLVHTLSTVTEISDLQVSPRNSSKEPNIKIKKPNKWFTPESAKLDGDTSVDKAVKCTNIINWMALSPREKHRVLNHKESSDTWVGSHLNLAELCTENKLTNYGNQTNKLIQTENNGGKIRVDVEVHEDKSVNTSGAEVNYSDTAVNFVNGSISANKQLKYFNVIDDFHKDRGDHSTKSVVAPAIRLTPNYRKPIQKTDAIDKFDDSNWIEGNQEEKETSVYDYVLERSESFLDDNKIDDVWMNNAVPFLKPSEWIEYGRIADSPISYHLTLSSIIEERQSWFKRIINFFKCCK